MEVGVTDLATFEVTVPTLLSILPTPFEKTAVKLTLDPKAIVADDAVKLVIVGAGRTVTVTEEVIESPIELVTVKI